MKYIAQIFDNGEDTYQSVEADSTVEALSKVLKNANNILWINPSAKITKGEKYYSVTCPHCGNVRVLNVYNPDKECYRCHECYHNFVCDKEL